METPAETKAITLRPHHMFILERISMLASFAHHSFVSEKIERDKAYCLSYGDDPAVLRKQTEILIKILENPSINITVTSSLDDFCAVCKKE